MARDGAYEGAALLAEPNRSQQVLAGIKKDLHIAQIHPPYLRSEFY